VRIATWNVNSLRARLSHLQEWLAANPVDVIGLQETKCTEEQFPHEALQALGYGAVHNGQKSYNGVALLSRAPALDVARDMPPFEDEQRRVIAATIGGLRVVNVYVVNGQAVGTEKYAYKLRWLEALQAYLAQELARHPRLVVLGDFNVAPAPADVHDPREWEGSVLFSEAEREHFRRLLELGLRDAYRLFIHGEQGFTWWDYRLGSFRRNRGLRIDHILVSAALAGDCVSCEVDVVPRKLPSPSDHAPVVAEFRLPGEPVPGAGPSHRLPEA
jgi:exodeoxyribonuclease III